MSKSEQFADDLVAQVKAWNVQSILVIAAQLCNSIGTLGTFHAASLGDIPRQPVKPSRVVDHDRINKAQAKRERKNAKRVRDGIAK